MIMASSSSSSREWKYDVFLSFRGGDTRKNFTSHLYKALTEKGIVTFKDDRELPRGEPFPQQIPLAIHQSRILLVILSQNYAASPWCMDELVEIYKCKEAGTGQIVYPVFYGVDPSDVSEQTGHFGAAFAKQERLVINGVHRVRQWRTAATKIADLSGWDLKQYRDEAEFIEEIVKCINHMVLSRLSHSITKDFVGMESRLEKFLSYLGLDKLDDNRIVGIVGMGGIGKTTLASVVYQEICGRFDARCFLEDVRTTSEKSGLVHLQNQLLSAALMEKNVEVYDRLRGIAQIPHRLGRKKVLIILDDVSHLDQIEVLIGRRGETWFGPGSRIIITTRDERLLIHRIVDGIYRAEELGVLESLELFLSNAIQDSSQRELVDLCLEVVQYAGGLPLALKVLGSSLYGKSKGYWEKMVGRLKEVPNEEILSKLQLSYDGLQEIQKVVFLDIACFFNGYKEDYVISVLKSYRVSPEVEIDELKDKSLVTITDGVLKMHDLLEEMGRQIVHNKSPNDPGQRSRIWLQRDFLDIMERDTGTKEIEGIVLNESADQQDEKLEVEAFLKMKNLRLLILRCLQFLQDIAHLSNSLSYLNWYGFPFKYFAPEFQPNKLVELHLQHSCIEYLWENIKPVKFLKTMNLSHSENLAKTPDFKQVPNLENLNLEGCVKLLELHESIGALEKLVSLNLKDCKKLASLPTSMCNLKSLKILNLSGCLGLAKFFGTMGFLKCLEELDVAGIMKSLLTRIKGFLQFFRSPPQPDPLALRNLAELNLSDIGLTEGAIPSDWSRLPLLKILDLSGNDFLSISSTISQLSQLTSLKAIDCKRLQALPDLSPSIRILNLKGCVSLESLPGLSPLKELEHLEFGNCTSLKSLPPLPSSVERLLMENCTSLQNHPVLFDKFSSCKRREFYIGLPNCSTLNHNQNKVDMISVWLESYMRWVMSVRRQMKSCPFWNQYGDICEECIDREIRLPDFYTCFPGNVIPDWFNHQSTNGPSMLIQLSREENLRNIAGFAVCAVVKRRPESRADWWLEVRGKTGEFESWSNRFPLPGDSALRFDHLGMFFVVNHRLDCPTEESRPTQLLFSIYGNEFESRGIRIVLDQDLERMFPQDTEDLPPPCHGGAASSRLKRMKAEHFVIL